MTAQEKRETRIYGYSEQKLREFMDSEFVQNAGLKEVIMSMLSNAQDKMDHDPEAARQLINRVKYLVKHKMK